MLTNQRLKALIACSAAIAFLPMATYAASTTYNNVFISYYTPQNVEAMVNYSLKNQLGGLIMWEFRGDADVNSADSLLKTALNTYSKKPGATPIVMGYWSNWSVYTADPSTRAIPAPAYAVPGSTNNAGQVVVNPDFTNKLEAMNVVTYSFVEAQAKTYFDFNAGTRVNNPNTSEIGTLYFNDPWADLVPDDKFCANNSICWFATRMQKKPDNDSAKMGNFIAFTKLKHSNSNNPLGPLKKIISVGGYGHDDTFEDTFAYSKDDKNEPYMDNFVNSAARIIANYGLDGIDLDYENPAMDHAKSQEYLKLIQKLRAKLGKNILITVTTLAGPEYLRGSESNNTIGFAKNTLKQIADIADRINLMTYDMHGAFDYDEGKGRTGFITNLVMPNGNDVPAGYDARFSVDAAVKAVLEQGIPATKVNIGIPAYGRALTGIPAANGGLFQIIPRSGTIPRGDLDNATCSTTLPLSDNSCSGSFQYRYIISNMRSKGFTETIRSAKDEVGQTVSNGTTAYATTWSTSDNAGHNLQITNTGTGSDLGFQVSVYDSGKTHLFGPSDWMSIASDKTYSGQTNPNTLGIDNATNLTVHWDTGWGLQGDCPTRFNFTANTHIMVKLNNQGQAVCDIKTIQ